MTPIRHIDCGAIVVWYTGEPGPQLVRSRDIFYLDGTRPASSDPIPNCPSCGEQLTLGGSRANARRCFDEDLDPGLAVETAISADNAASQANL